MDYEKSCEILEGGINKLITILQQKRGSIKVKAFRNEEFVKLYDICYKLCVEQTDSKHSEKLYELHSATFNEYLNQTVFPILKTFKGDKLLHEFVERWRQHKIMTKWMRMLFRYLNRFFIKQHNKPSLEDSALSKFRTLVYGKLKEPFIAAVLDLINRCRENKTGDISILRESVEIFVALTGKTTLENPNQNSPFLDIYSTDFENSFLESSRTFYQQKATVWLESMNIGEFLRKVDETFDSEIKVTNRYFQNASQTVWNRKNGEFTGNEIEFQNEVGTLAKLMVVLRECVLGENEEKLLIRGDTGGFKYLLKEMHKKELALLYKLFKDVDKGLDPIAKEFKDFIKLEGSKIPRPGKKVDEILRVVGDYIDLHEKYESLVDIEFQRSSLLARAMKEAFEKILNLVTNPEDKKEITSAEMIATYMDKQQSSKKLDEETRRNNLEKAVKLFLYLEEKDRFSEIYRMKLSKRLLNGITNESIESQMIMKFKSHLGGGYTTKMEGMVKDLMTGKTSKGKFQDYCVSNSLADKSTIAKGMVKMSIPNYSAPLLFGVDLLTRGYWPNNLDIDLKYPEEMQNCLKLYEQFYSSESDAKKKIGWIHTLGTCVISANIGGKDLELTLTTLQAAAILLFNTDEPIAFQAVQKELNINENVCKKVLHSFLKAGILKKQGGKSSKKIDVELDEFEINNNFKSKSPQFKVKMPSLEESHNPKRVSEDRKDAIDAALVRIMKTRKKYEHNRLIGDAMQQLHFFRPDGKQIKKRIESLIERDYIERDETQSNLYLYVS